MIIKDDQFRTEKLEKNSQRNQSVHNETFLKLSSSLISQSMFCEVQFRYSVNSGVVKALRSIITNFIFKYDISHKFVSIEYVCRLPIQVKCYILA